MEALTTEETKSLIGLFKAAGRLYDIEEWIAEGLLEDMEFDPLVTGLSWYVFGGESGTKARRCEVSWIRRGVRRCQEAGAKVYVKRLGTRPHPNGDPLKLESYKGEDWPEDLRIREFPDVA